jgi:phosphoribosylamine--glycine ligase
MKILLVGAGGREHALAWAIAKSPLCSMLYCAPGNPGIEAHAKSINIKVHDVENIVKFAQDEAIDLVVVGPEKPFVEGLADRLQSHGIKVFGPSAKAARLEGSKAFMKDLCAKYGIPTASYKRFTKFEDAKTYIEKSGAPIVVKADGLAAGKGAVVCMSVEDALNAAQGMLSGAMFGAVGTEIVIEQFLDGEELSYFALTDGKTMLPLASAQDHKRAFDGDEGPNTGGMGAYSPAHLMTAELEEKILHRIIKPTIAAMAKEGCPFSGVLYAGVMVVRGEPYLIEYNVRFGDPECQALVMRLQGDFLEIMLAGAEGRLNALKGKVTWSDQTAMCVVMATKGYPGDYPQDTVIRGLDAASKHDPQVQVFHAGTKHGADGAVLSAGGRVLGITALGKDALDAQQKAYRVIDLIDWPDGFCRRDIGWRAIKAAQGKAA